MTVKINEADQRHWFRVKEICLQALQLDSGARSAFLAEACGEDEHLRREVQELVEHGGSKSCLDGPPICSLSKLVAEEETGLPLGKQIGEYRIIRRIASGGMSDVYLASRGSTQNGESAAVKVLRHASASAQSIKRFQREQRIQASLRHPQIAQFKDSGIADNGQYYLIMEYVHGAPITTYCQEHGLSLNQRLALFCQVCEAVSYAHGMLIIHRDLKPTNILVSADCTPKLLDFGGVKILEPTEGIDVFETADHGQLPFTLAYASPELIRNEPVSTRSDVFSLGVILFELITGTHPFSAKVASPFELAKAICEENPMPIRAAMRAARRRPSEHVERNGDTAEAARSVDTPAGYRTRDAHIPSDLATIIEMALQTEPDRRYTSVERLSDDIQNYLSGMPVRARKDSVAYRTVKFVRRHKRAVVAITAVFLTLACGVIGTTWGLVSTQRERDNALRARAQNASVLHFLESVLEPNGRFARGPDTTLQEVMEYADAQLENCTDRESEAAIRHALGRIRMRFGDYDGALRHLAKAQSIRVDALGWQHPETIESTCELIDIMIAAGKNEEARELLDEVRALPATGSTKSAGDTATVWLLDGKLHGARKDHVSARRSFERALTLLRADPEADAAQMGGTLYQLARLHRELREYGKADDYLAEAIEINRQAGVDDQLLATYLNDRALMFQSQGRVSEAEALYRESIEVHIRSVGQDHIEVAKVRFNLGTLLEDRGEFTEAETLYRDSLNTIVNVLGERHTGVITVRKRLAYLLFRQGRLDESKAMFQYALDMASKHFGEDSWETSLVMTHYAILLKNCDQYGDAMRLYRRVLDITRRELGDESVEVGIRLWLAAQVLMYAGDLTAAESMLDESVRILEAGLDSNNPRLLRARTRLGRLYYLQGRYDEAETILRDVLQLTVKDEMKSREHEAQAETRLAEVLSATGRAAEAEPLARSGLAGLTKALPPGHVRIAYGQTVLGECLTELGQYEEARKLLTQGYGDLQETGRLNGGRTIRALERLIRLHEALGETSLAKHLRGELEVLERRKTDRPDSAPATEKITKR